MHSTTISARLSRCEWIWTWTRHSQSMTLLGLKILDEYMCLTRNSLLLQICICCPYMHVFMKIIVIEVVWQYSMYFFLFSLFVYWCKTKLNGVWKLNTLKPFFSCNKNARCFATSTFFSLRNSLVRVLYWFKLKLRKKEN